MFFYQIKLNSGEALQAIKGCKCCLVSITIVYFYLPITQINVQCLEHSRLSKTFDKLIQATEELQNTNIEGI